MSLAWREGVTYTYDGDGNRVEKANGRLFWYGAGTEILDESDLTGSITLEMVYFGGKRVAHRTSSNVIYYYEGDMLGSARTIVQAGQTTVCYDADFLPFGGERDIVNTCSQNYKFEGKKRDNETGNDDFGARFYRSNIGRWMSADWSSVPAPVPYANLTNPQTLNLYAMVSDNPETFADLDGHQCNTASTGSVGSNDHNACPGPAATKTAKQGEGQSTGDGTDKSKTQQAQQLILNPIKAIELALGMVPARTDAEKQTAEQMKSVIGLVAGGEGDLAEGAELISAIGKDAKLVKYAEEAGKSVQKSLDHLVEELGKGNTNPGIGNRSLGGGISYARTRDGARVFFRQAGQRIEILAKASKANEENVINYLKKFY